MFITTMLVRLTNNDVMMQASASAKSERLGRTSLCYVYAPILAIREQPNLCQLHVVRIYSIPCNIFFEARDMIQMEAQRRERWAWYRTQRLAEQSLKSKATHLKGADPVRHKLPLWLSLLSAFLHTAHHSGLIFPITQHILSSRIHATIIHY